MAKILTSRKDYLEDNKLTSTRQIIDLKSHFSTAASSKTYTAQSIQFAEQYFERRQLTDMELAEYLAAKILADKDEKQFYTNSVSSKIQTQFLTLNSSVEISNTLIKINFSSLVNNFISKLQKKYLFSNPIEVIEYLSEKNYLISWLLQAHQKIRKIFPNEQLVLRVAFDPEIVGWKRLLIAIQTNIDADEAFERIKILDNDWWLEAAYEIGNDLDIHIEFNEF